MNHITLNHELYNLKSRIIEPYIMNYRTLHYLNSLICYWLREFPLYYLIFWTKKNISYGIHIKPKLTQFIFLRNHRLNGHIGIRVLILGIRQRKRRTHFRLGSNLHSVIAQPPRQSISIRAIYVLQIGIGLTLHIRLHLHRIRQGLAYNVSQRWVIM